MLPDIEHFDKVRDGWLLDTNILSAMMGRRQPAPGIQELLEKIRDDRFFVSVITIGEITKGIELIPIPPRAKSNSPEWEKHQLLQGKLESFMRNWSDRILPVDSKIASKWGELQGRYRKRGKSIPAVDALIAATAYVHNLVVVSHDQTFELMREHITLYDPLA